MLKIKKRITHLISKFMKNKLTRILIIPWLNHERESTWTFHPTEFVHFLMYLVKILLDNTQWIKRILDHPDLHQQISLNDHFVGLLAVK